MSDFEDDLTESEVTESAPAKKQGMSFPKVSTPVALGTTLAVLLGGVGVWFALNSANPTVAPPDPVITSQPSTPSNPDAPINSATPDAPTGTATSGNGVEAGNIPLIAAKPKPVVAPTASTTTIKPVVKPAPKPAAPRIVNPFAPLPKTNTGLFAGANNQGSTQNVNFQPQTSQGTFQPPPSNTNVTVVQTTATPTIRTPVATVFFGPRPTSNPAVDKNPPTAGTSTRIQPVPVVVTSQKPVIPKTITTTTPAALATSKPRPLVTTPIARGSFSVAPPLLSNSPRVQAPIQAVTPPAMTTGTTPPATASTGQTPRPNGVTQTPVATNPTSRPTTPEPPIFKIEPAPSSTPAVTTPSTPKPVITTPATPSTPIAIAPSTPTPATSPVATAPTTPTNPVVTPPTAPDPATPAPDSVAPVTTPATAPTTPATAPAAVTTEPSTSPTASTPATPPAPSAELVELRRIVQDDLRLEYAGFSIGTVKKAFFQSSRGLLSIAEGDPLTRDSNIVLKSVSPTEVVLALGNEILTLPLVKR